MDLILQAAGLLVAVVPGLVLAGLRSRLQREDPLFSERNGRAFAWAFLSTLPTVFASIWAATPWYLLLPTVVFGLLAGMWPADKGLWGYDWSLPESMSYRLRSLTASFGFWIVLGFAPLLVSSVGERWYFFAGITLLLPLAYWSFFYNKFRVWISRAEPVGLASFPLLKEITEHSDVDDIQVYRLPSGRGACPQAFASPQPTSMNVHIGDTLFDELTPVELAGIFGHEVAHLEQATAAGDVRALGAFELWLSFISTLPLPAAVILGSPAWFYLALAWPVIVMFGLLRYMASRKHNEEAADERGAELCGNPEAMVSALEKIHVLNGLPTRMAASKSDSASHPDLVHRRRALVGSEREDVGSLSIQDVRKPTKTAVLDNDGIAVTDRGQVTELAYKSMSVLTVVPSWRGPVLFGRIGDNTEVKLYVDKDEVARIQAFLTKVHARIGTERPPALGFVRWVMAALVFTLVFGWTSTSPVFWAAYGAAGGGRLAWGAVRAMLLGSAVLTLLGWTTALPVVEYGWVVVALVGGVALYPWKVPNREIWTRYYAVAFLLMALCTVICWVVAWGHGLGDPTRVHFQIRENPALVLLPLGLAGALWEMKPLWSRGLAPVPLALSLAIAAAGTDWFRDGYVTDPLAVRAPPAVVEVPDLEMLAEVILPEGTGKFRISPDGSHWAREMEGGGWWVATVGEEPQILDVHAMEFTGPDTVVAWEGGRIRGGSIAADAWELDVSLIDPQLRVSGSEWILTGASSSRGPFVHMRGKSTDPTVAVTTVLRPLDEALVTSTGTWSRTLTDSERDYNSFGITGNTMLSDAVVTWSLGRPQGIPKEQFQSALWSSCTTVKDQVICGVAATGTLVHLPTQGPPRGVVELPGIGAWPGDSYGSRLVVWTDKQLLIVDLSDGTTLDVPHDRRDCVQLVLGENRVGRVSGCEEQTLTIYAVNPS